MLIALIFIRVWKIKKYFGRGEQRIAIKKFFYDVKASFLKVMTSRLGVYKLLPQFINS